MCLTFCLGNFGSSFWEERGLRVAMVFNSYTLMEGKYMMENVGLKVPGFKVSEELLRLRTEQ